MCISGVSWGIHATLLGLLTLESWGWISISKSIFDYETLSLSGQVRLQMASQWYCYITAMCTFHLLECFTTAIYNAKISSANSYLVNHSKAYRATFLIAGTEFWFKFLVLIPSSFPWTCRLGMGMVLLAQMICSLYMITCRESFNHLIQTSKKDNYILITNVIYQWFRHPSYICFYYWSIGTQLVLNNALFAIVFGSASCMFFRRRIPCEEELPSQHFLNKYVVHVKWTWVGILFIPSCIAEPKKEKDS
jgi:protein-S-isoprenylcysteine O-methyltransferase